MSSAVNEVCHLCGLFEDIVVDSKSHDELLMVQCPACGKYEITQSVVRKELGQEIKYKLSAWTRGRKESGQPTPLISGDNIDTIISSFPNYSVADKQRLLIQVLAESTPHPGKSVFLNYRLLCPRAWAADCEEIHYLIEALRGRDLIKFTQKTGDRTSDFCQITPAGWGYIDNMERERSKSKQVFVAMCFDSTMNTAWKDGIRPAIMSAGYRPYRVDRDPSNLERIDAKIEMEIKRSRFLVADVTGGRQGIYYEAGYAMALGLPVIWSVNDNHVDDMHFDTRQYNHIIWSTPEDLADQLKARVIAAIGEI